MNEVTEELRFNAQYIINLSVRFLEKIMMLKTNLKIALRSLIKQKFYSLINILGLATGLAACLFIVLFIIDELSYDKFHSKSDNIYRLITEFKVNGQDLKGGEGPAPLAEVMSSDFPEVESAVRIFKSPQQVIGYERKSFIESKILAVDSNFFEVFDFELIEGNKRTALAKTNGLVLTENVAQKYFGEHPALGKMITLGEGESYEVTGVVANVPPYSHFHFDILIPMFAIPSSKIYDWGVNDFYTYIVLRDGVNLKSFSSKLGLITLNHLKPLIEGAFGTTYQEFKRKGNKWEYSLQSLKRIHLYSSLSQELETNGSIINIYAYSLIALFIILLACVNFVNLYTARSNSRALEVGVRKTLGAVNKSLFFQFIIEAILICFISMIIAIILVFLLIPFLNEVLEKSLTMKYFFNPYFLTSIVIFIILVGFLAGSYPALHLISFKPSEVLKGKMKSRAENNSVKDKLIVFQFTISIGMIILTLSVREQINFLQSKNPGYLKDNVIVIPNFDKLKGSQIFFKETLSGNSMFISSTISSALPALPSTFNYSGIMIKAENDLSQDHLVLNIKADKDFVQTFDIKMVEGRFFSDNFSDDSTAVVINEMAVNNLGFKNPIGHYLYEGDAKRKIIGVVKDFNLESLKKTITPIVIYKESFGNFISIRFNSTDVNATIEILRKKWEALVPDYPFTYSFLDENLNSLYKAETRINRVLNIFSLLSIFIAGIGLLGLAAFTSQQRSREIAIRKIMGATTFNLMMLLLKDFVKLVIVAFVIATPVSYWIITKWLEDYSNRIEINFMVFIFAGILSLIFSSLIICFQTFKVAVNNPINSLK